MAGYIEKIADLLPEDRREEWLRLATPHKAVFQEGDELMLILWTLALIGEDMSGKSALVTDAVEQWDSEKEVVSDKRLKQLVSRISNGIEEKAPSFKDLKTVTHELATAARLLGKGKKQSAAISPFSTCMIIIMAGIFSGLATFAVTWIKESTNNRAERLQSSIPATENFFAIIHGRGGEVEATDDELIIKGTTVEVEKKGNQTTIRFK